jgi:hypothetical protein
MGPFWTANHKQLWKQTKSTDGAKSNRKMVAGIYK